MEAGQQRLINAFRQRFGSEPRWLAQAPGRVNLIGEHTDYNEGHVLPIAIDRTIAVAAAPGGGGTVRAYAVDFEEEDSFPLDAIQRLPDGGWRNYVRGVASVLKEAGLPVRGLQLAISGDIPIAAGLSSSAALEVALVGAFQAAAGQTDDPRETALLAQRSENEFVGVSCGIMDQMAAVLGRRDHALLIDCRNLETEAIPLGFAEQGVRIVVVNSGLPRALESSPYNLRRQECQEAARRLAVPALGDLDEATLEAHRGALPDNLYRRARHVVREEGRVRAAVAALRCGDLGDFGQLLYQSHQSLRDDFQVSCRELDLLVEMAQPAEGVLGARLTGAGFGGCTVNLVREEALAPFQAHVVERYRSLTGLGAAMYVCQAVDGLRVTHV